MKKVMIFLVLVLSYSLIIGLIALISPVGALVVMLLIPATGSLLDLVFNWKQISIFVRGVNIVVFGGLLWALFLLLFPPRWDTVTTVGGGSSSQVYSSPDVVKPSRDVILHLDSTALINRSHIRLSSVQGYWFVTDPSRVHTDSTGVITLVYGKIFDTGGLICRKNAPSDRKAQECIRVLFR